MRFEGISCDECRKTIPEPEFQIAVYTEASGKVRKLEAAKVIDSLELQPQKGYILLDICGCHCLQKSLMRLMEKLQVESNGKHPAPDVAPEATA